jgi:ribosomal protein L9
LLYKCKFIKRLSKALSTAVQLLLPSQQKRKQQQLKRPALAVAQLLEALMMLIRAWAEDATSTHGAANKLQIALQVAESGVHLVRRQKCSSLVEQKVGPSHHSL